MIGLAMEKWPSDALRRVVDAPVERWMDGRFHSCADGWWDATVGTVKRIGGVINVCLYGFACEQDEPWDQALRRLEGKDWRDRRSPVTRYDLLVKRFGLPRIVRALKLRALRILEQREPLVSRVAVIRTGSRA